jgi:hypothetical protein
MPTTSNVFEARNAAFPVRNVTKKRLTSTPQSASLMRLLTYVLLFLIAYGATAETVHRHGNWPLKPPDTTAHSVNYGNGQSSSGGPIVLTDDCLVCQFQRGLSSTAIFNPALVLAAPVSQVIISTAKAPYFSATQATKRGRAPPSIS